MNICLSLSTGYQIVAYNKYQMWSDKVQMGSTVLKNRIALAALTRCRCDPANGIPTPLHVTYYGQRAGAGLMITQSTPWSKRGIGYLGGAQLFNWAHVEGWRRVTDAVHAKGSRIYVQLMHAGRVTHSLKTQGLEIFAPSATPLVDETIRDLNHIAYTTPKAMSKADILQTKAEYEESVKLAKAAGFDGVQLQAAHGYLVDQFLKAGTNKRQDEYGGSKENRCRFALQLIDITLKYFQSSQVGIKISMVSRGKDMNDNTALETFKYLMGELDTRGIGFVEIRENPKVEYNGRILNLCQELRSYYKGIIIGNDGFNEETGIQKIRSGSCQMISFGRLYVSNPDLAERILNKHPLNYNWNQKLYYGWELGSKGYIDYPTYQEQMRSKL